MENIKDLRSIDMNVVRKHSPTTALVLSITEENPLLSQEQVGKLINISRTAVTRHIKCLRENGYIPQKQLSETDIQDLVINIDKKNICDWCKGKVAILEEHHYPVSAKDGGTDVVNICPNCHRAFHQIEDINGRRI